MKSKEEIYKNNQRKIKIYTVLKPIVFWSLLALSLLCLCYALKNSFGNMSEIISLLDTKKYNGEQLQLNYQTLVAKYGEWVIGNGDNGFTLVFINVKNALFSGIAITCFFSSILQFISAFLLGKWLLPALKEKTLQDNQDMCNLEILRAVDKGEVK